MNRWRAMGPLLVVVIFMALAAVATMAAGSSARDLSLVDVTTAGPKLWQEQEAPAYVPVLRDLGDAWRSVRLPPAYEVEDMLRESAAIPLDASPEEIEAAVTAWYQQARKDAYIGPDPLAYHKLMAVEKARLDGEKDWTLPTPPKSVMVVTVNFDGTDTITRAYPDPNNPNGACVDTEFTWGPLDFGDDPPPGPRDNFEFFKLNFTLQEYEEAFFGEGPQAGYLPFEHPVLGTIDLRGSTLQNYLLEHSGDLAYRAGGAVVPAVVTVPHSQEYYGYARYRTTRDSEGNITGCVSSVYSDANYGQFPLDVAEATRSQLHDRLDCSQFDADGDHIVDLFVMIHAGRAYQNGGGTDRLTTSSSTLFPQQEQVCGHSTPDDDSDDYFIQGFNVDPEQLDIGAIQEEFEHQFGLPDLYSVDSTSNSNAWWGAHSAGVWGGPLGGTRPVGHNLWQDYVLGWRDPVVVNYDDPELELTMGRARYKPQGTADGLIVKLPDRVTQVKNLAGEGIGWWSTSGDMMDNRVYREWDLSGATGQVMFAFDAYWDLEEGWDYGYFGVSLDGETWTTLPDMDGILTDTNPNGNNLGWGLTASGEGRLRFDLSSMAGQPKVYTRLRYLTDPSVSNPGWWVDNVAVYDEGGDLYFNDLEDDFSDWTVAGWTVVPFDQIDEHYYLFEWRDDNGFDQSLNDAYSVYYRGGDPGENVVDRMAYTTPGMTVSYRDMGKDFDYEISSDIGDSPSFGPKHGLIVIESHFFPKRFDTLFSSVSGGYVGPTPSGRALPGDGAFGFTPTNEWTAHLGYDYVLGQYVDPPLELKTWASEPAVRAFHDSMGYYPGFFHPGSGSLFYVTDFDASAAVPAQDDYTTRITWPDFEPFPALYGVPIGPAGLGTGNPGDNNVQYGVHVEVVDQAEDGSWGTLRFWNSMLEFEGAVTQMANSDVIVPGSTVQVMVEAMNIGGAVDGFFVLPIDPDTEYVYGSAYGGAMPLSAAKAADLAAEHGLADLAKLAAEKSADDVVAVAFMGEVGTGEMVDFGFTVSVVSPTGTVHHSVAMFDGSHFFQDIHSDFLAITDNSGYDVMRSRRFDVSMDTYINGTQPTVNAGSASTMWAGFDDNLRPVVWADFPVCDNKYECVTPDAAIDTAYLYLYVTEGRGFGNWVQSVMTMSAHQVMSSWTEGGATWLSPWVSPGGDVGPALDALQVGSARVGTWLRFEVTDAISAMVNGGVPNYGFVVASDPDFEFMSSPEATLDARFGLAAQEYWQPGKVGYLRIMYRTAD